VSYTVKNLRVRVRSEARCPLKLMRVCALIKNLIRLGPVRVLIGSCIAVCLRAWARTYEVKVIPADALSKAKDYLPCILATWHGQNYALAAVPPPTAQIKILLSRSIDGELLQPALQRLGYGTIRGSGAGAQRDKWLKKGGVQATSVMIDALRQGFSIAMTADTFNESRIAGKGVIALAGYSGRPIIPLAITTSNRWVLNNRDRTTVNLPFGRSLVLIGEPISVPNLSDLSVVERRFMVAQKRSELELALNSLNAEALRIVDGT
jgi:lysophospholipid acyltransferase (LPLAT)-like uncharacterized protein